MSKFTGSKSYSYRGYNIIAYPYISEYRWYVPVFSKMYDASLDPTLCPKFRFIKDAKQYLDENSVYAQKHAPKNKA